MDYKCDQEFHFLKAADSFINTWYTWGGDDPSGIDCSGLVVACLKACGIMGHGEDETADGLWHKFHGRYSVTKPERGALAFWFDGRGIATHVVICISPYFCITASGGGRHVLTQQDAIKHNAFVKMRPIFSRTDPPRFTYLWK